MTGDRPPGTTIRHATPADTDEIRRCVSGAYEPYVSRIGGLPAPMLADYDALIERGAVSVAIRAGRLVGVLVAWPELDHLHIDNVATSTEFRGTGVGRALIESAERAAQASGLDELRLYTNVAMSENLDYYSRRGFIETHRSTVDGYDRVYFAKRLDTR